MPLRFSPLAGLLAVPCFVLAQGKPPVAQFWMDVATHNLSIPGMDEAGDMGLVGNMFGGTRMTGGAPGKWLDTALFTRNKPEGTEGSHAVPSALRMGNTLPLLPVKAVTSTVTGGNTEWDKPKGKLLFYWGCGETVRAGQPKVLDFAKADAEAFSRFVTGRYAPDRGAKAIPGRSVWPNERDHQRVPKNASLEGEHAVTGEGVPASLRFALPAGYNFMPKVQMGTRGDPKESVTVEWQSVTNARGYFLSAIGSRGEDEMVVWSSSEQPDPGWGLLDYVAPAQVDKLIGQKVVLPASVQHCAVPKGIFAQAEGAMVRMIAYGPELNLSHPPKPADPKAPWNPEWAARVRVKSTGTTLLGADSGGGTGSTSSGEDAKPSGPLKLLKGLFGG